MRRGCLVNCWRSKGSACARAGREGSEVVKMTLPLQLYNTLYVLYRRGWKPSSLLILNYLLYRSVGMYNYESYAYIVFLTFFSCSQTVRALFNTLNCDMRRRVMWRQVYTVIEFLCCAFNCYRSYDVCNVFM